MTTLNPQLQMRNLRGKMRRSGLTAPQMAELTGVSPSAVRQIRTDPNRYPRIDTYAALSNALDKYIARRRK